MWPCYNATYHIFTSSHDIHAHFMKREEKERVELAAAMLPRSPARGGTLGLLAYRTWPLQTKLVSHGSHGPQLLKASPPALPVGVCVSGWPVLAFLPHGLALPRSKRRKHGRCRLESVDHEVRRRNPSSCSLQSLSPGAERLLPNPQPVP